MKTLFALLLMTTAAAAQGSSGTPMGVPIDPLGPLIILIGGDVSGQGVATARFVIENVSGRPLEIAADGDAPAGIGSCVSGGGASSAPSYSGIVAGFDLSKGSMASRSLALRTLRAGDKIPATMQVNDCSLTGQSVVKVTVPVFVVDTIRGSTTYSLTSADVPVFPN